LFRALVVYAIGLCLTTGGVLAEDTAAPQDSTALPFAGIHIGDPRSKLEDHFRDKETGETTCHSESGISGHVTCKYIESPDASGIQRLGEIPYNVLAFDYLHDKLIGFRLWTPVKNYTALHDLLVRLYGDSGSDDESMVVDRRGRPLDQITSQWKTLAGVLELEKRSWSVDQSRLMMIVAKGQNEILKGAEPDAEDTESDTQDLSTGIGRVPGGENGATPGGGDASSPGLVPPE